MAIAKLFSFGKTAESPAGQKATVTDLPRAATVQSHDDFYHDVKHAIHRRLVEEINLAALDALEVDEARPEVAKIINAFLAEDKIALNESERAELVEEIMDELKGLGPIEPLMKDPTVSDILCNTYKDIYVERHGLI